MSPALREVGLEGVVLDFLGELGWAVQYGPDIAPGELAAERDDYREVVLAGRLRQAVVQLNPELPLRRCRRCGEDGAAAGVAGGRVGELARVPPAGGGCAGRLSDASDGSIRSARARLIDFDHPGNNDFLAVNQFTVLGTRERRPDVVLFINGLPVVLMELKRPGDENATLRGAFNQIQTYRARHPGRVHLESGDGDLRRHPGARGFVHRGLGALRAVEDDRRAGPGAGRAAAVRGARRGHVPAWGAARPGTELRRRLRRGPTDGEAGREVPPVLGGPQGRRLHGRGGRGATDGPVSSGTPRVRARAWRCCSTPARSCATRRWRTRPSWSSPTATTSTTSCSTRCSPGPRWAPRCPRRRCRRSRASTSRSCCRLARVGRHRLLDDPEVRAVAGRQAGRSAVPAAVGPAATSW